MTVHDGHLAKQDGDSSRVASSRIVAFSFCSFVGCFGVGKCPNQSVSWGFAWMLSQCVEMCFDCERPSKPLCGCFAKPFLSYLPEFASPASCAIVCDRRVVAIGAPCDFVDMDVGLHPKNPMGSMDHPSDLEVS